MASHPSSSSHQVTSDEGYDSQNLVGTTHQDRASLKLLLDAIQGLTADVHEMQQRQQETMDEIRRLSDTVHNLEDRIASVFFLLCL